MDQETRIEELVAQLEAAMGDETRRADLEASPSFQRARAGLSQAMRQLGVRGGDGMVQALMAYPQILDQLEPAIQLARRPAQVDLLGDLEAGVSKLGKARDVAWQMIRQPGMAGELLMAAPGTGAVSALDLATAAGEIAGGDAGWGPWADAGLSALDIASELGPVAAGLGASLPAALVGGGAYLSHRLLGEEAEALRAGQLAEEEALRTRLKALGAGPLGLAGVGLGSGIGGL